MIESYRKITESKRALRRELACRPVGEKLRILDSLRERQLAIQKGRDLRSGRDKAVKPAR